MSSATKANGRTRLDRACTPAWFLKSVDGDGFSLPLPLSKQLVEQGFVLTVAYAEPAALLPEEQLFGTGQKGVPKVQFQGSAIGIPVRDRIDNGVAGYLVGSVLDQISQHEGFVVTEVPLVEVGLDRAGDFLECVFAISTLDFLEVATRSARHAGADHVFPCVLPVIQRIGWFPSNDPLWLSFYSK